MDVFRPQILSICFFPLRTGCHARESGHPVTADRSVVTGSSASADDDTWWDDCARG
jgi:hypothetical protein